MTIHGVQEFIRNSVVDRATEALALKDPVACFRMSRHRASPQDGCRNYMARQPRGCRRHFRREQRSRRWTHGQCRARLSAGKRLAGAISRLGLFSSPVSQAVKEQVEALM